MSDTQARRIPKKVFILLIGIVLLIVLGRVIDLQSTLYQFLSWMQSRGSIGIILFMILYILMTICLLPGSLLTMAAGLVFGFPIGFISVSIAATVGATAAFFLGRYVARSWVQAKIASSSKFNAIDRAIEKEGWIIVGLLRLSPIVPFNISNYFFGITRIPAVAYILVSWLCMLPGTALYVYIGSLIGDLALIGLEDRVRSPLEWGFYVFGLLATVAVSIIVVRRARSIIHERIPGQASHHNSQEVNQSDDAE